MFSMGRQKWGQHFLVNRGVVKKIIDQIPGNHPTYLEIGPGKGILTEELIRRLRDKKIVAVEIDPVLAEGLLNSHGESIRLIRHSILDITLQSLEEPLPVYIVGNVPYYLSSDLLLWLVREHRHIAGGILMIQKEFMDKIQLAPPVPRTILFRMFFRPQRSFSVSPGSFAPPPKVQSSVFRFDSPPPSAGGDIIPVDEMEKFLRQCFSHRRKTLIRNILPLANRTRLEDIFEALDIPAGSRGEELSVDQFKGLFLKLKSTGGLIF